MISKGYGAFAALFVVSTFTLGAIPAVAQTPEVKEKPPMYTYVANWQIPREHWAEMPQTEAANKALLDKALADGTLVGYGDDAVVVHQIGGETHDDWWSATSMAGLIKVLDQLEASGTTASPALNSATKHWDEILVSHYYHWHSGPYKAGYTHIASYELKGDAPGDAVDSLSKNLVVPLLEKLLADGTLLEYEIDEQALHTEAPGIFSIVYLTATPDGLDKVMAAVDEALKAQPLAGPAFGSMTKGSAHRDDLVRGEGVYK
jgi:hypothetical protein